MASPQESDDTVKIGGADLVVGGWAAYEAGRRAARWEAQPGDPSRHPCAAYGGRKWIGGQDAVDSLVLSRRGAPGGAADPLTVAAARLEAALGSYESAIARGRLPPPGSVIRISTAPPSYFGGAADETNPDALRRYAENANALARDPLPAALLPGEPDLPPLPRAEIQLRGGVSGGREVASLEREAVPRAEAVERLRSRVASVFDAAADGLESERLMNSKYRHDTTRRP